MASAHAPQTDWPKPYTRVPRKVPQFPESTRESWEQLQAALDAAPGWAVPCRDDGHGDDWIADDRAAQARAAQACAGCPLVQQCRDYAQSARKTTGLHGVWAGRHYSATPQKTPQATSA